MFRLVAVDQWPYLAIGEPDLLREGGFLLDDLAVSSGGDG